MDKIDTKIDVILEKVTDNRIDLVSIRKDVSVNSKSLVHHIKRTDLLEERIEQHNQRHEKQLETALIPIRWLKTTAKILGALAVILGILKTIGII